MIVRLGVSKVSLIILLFRNVYQSIAAMIDHGNGSHQNESGRIIGGETSLKETWPFMVSIGGPDKAGVRKHFCGGVIWDDETILTAAHCIVDITTGVIKHNLSTLNVYLGNTDLTTIDSTYLFNVKWVETHPLEEARKDIGIIKLAEKIDFEGKHSKVGCICNPEPLSELNSSACIALGWGLTKRPNPTPDLMFLPSKLHQVQQEIQSHSICQKTIDKHSNDKHKYDDVNFLCAGTSEKGVSRGDSGGPLVCQVKAHPEKYSLVGLTSFGHPEGPCFYTRVWTFMDWIETAAEGNSTEHARADSIFGEGHLVNPAFLGTFFVIGLLLGVAGCRRKQFNDSAKKALLMNKSSKLNRKILSKERSKKEKRKRSRKSKRKSNLRKLWSTRTARHKKLHKKHRFASTTFF